MTEFEKKFYKNFAIKFVDKYENESVLSAGVYATSIIKQEKMFEAEPFVHAEFLKRGYVFRDPSVKEINTKGGSKA